jgi:hypothetical protein
MKYSRKISCFFYCKAQGSLVKNIHLGYNEKDSFSNGVYIKKRRVNYETSWYVDKRWGLSGIKRNDARRRKGAYERAGE